MSKVFQTLYSACVYYIFFTEVWTGGNFLSETMILESGYCSSLRFTRGYGSSISTWGKELILATNTKTDFWPTWIIYSLKYLVQKGTEVI